MPADPRFTSSTPTKVSVGNTSTSVLVANYNRKYFALVNDSDEDIYISFSDTAVLNEGILLNASGGNIDMSINNAIYTGVITAICATGGKNLTVTEG